MQNININYFSNTKLCMIVLDARDHAVVVGIYGPPPKKLQPKITIISRIILVYYCKCCNVIGYSTRYLFIIR